MFDFGAGERRADLSIADRSVPVRLVGLYNSRRYYRTSNLTQALLAARASLGRLHPACRTILDLDAILDISGGDSFADLYGQRRFTDVTLPKRLALALGVRLILLPQTYGPYNLPSNRAAAARIVRGAAQCWARDEHSFSILRGLLADAFDPAKHHTGVDVAFGLPAARPADELAAPVERFASQWPLVVGLNVSGLLYNKPGEDAARYGFRSSYRGLIDELLRRLLALPDVGVLLVPHVAPTRPMIDDDGAACDAVLRGLPASARERVHALPRGLDASQLKWAIGRCAWFCGTRMHSTIGAISQGVPTTAIAYSDKTLGVFATAGVARCVVDPRTLEGPAVLDRVLDGFTSRDAAGDLADALPALFARLDEQFRTIVTGIGA